MKTIPLALENHLALDATTWCLLCRIECKDGTVLGFTNLDTSVLYDDGRGEVNYRADNGGFMPERYQATADLSVDNTDLTGWISDSGITIQQIRAGIFDYAKIDIYRVNYMDLSQGREIMGRGTLGQTQYGKTGWRNEFRGLTQQLKQTISLLYSLTCRAKFGDSKCAKAFTWVDGTVTALGVEADLGFTDSALTEDAEWYEPGVIEWLTGDNAGIESEVDTFSAGGVIELMIPLPNPIQVGDTFRIRQDCNKIAVSKNGMRGDCKDKHDNLLNFRGEHLIPVEDAGAALVPGAQVQGSGNSGFFDIVGDAVEGGG
jgi:phage conserved hypothetical protein BR0599